MTSLDEDWGAALDQQENELSGKVRPDTFVVLGGAQAIMASAECHTTCAGVEFVCRG